SCDLRRNWCTVVGPGVMAARRRLEPCSIGSNPMGGAGPNRHAKDSTMSQTRPTAVIVLAAGQGTRMISALPTVMHPIGGRSLLHHAVSAADGTCADHLVV